MNHAILETNMDTENNGRSLSSEETQRITRIMRLILEYDPNSSISQLVTLLAVVNHPNGINTLDLMEELNSGHVQVDKNRMWRQLNHWESKGCVAFIKHSHTRARYVIASPELQLQISQLDKGDN